MRHSFHGINGLALGSLNVVKLRDQSLPKEVQPVCGKCRIRKFRVAQFSQTNRPTPTGSGPVRLHARP